MHDRLRPSRVHIFATAAGVLAFAFRLTVLHDLSNDHYMHLAWAQQLLFGELPGRDFVDLGIAAAATFLVVAELTGSLAFAVAATLFEIVLEPRLYSYPKILVPAVALLLVQHYVRRPSR